MHKSKKYIYILFFCCCCCCFYIHKMFRIGAETYAQNCIFNILDRKKSTLDKE